MGLLDLFFGKKKSDRSKLEKETQNTVHRGCVTTTRVNVSSRNYEELLHRFIAFDTETTGLSSQMDIIIEVGAVKFSDGRIDNTYGSLINEGRSVPDEAYRVNHISTDMLRSKGKAPGLAYRELTDFLDDVLEGKCYICAHNASFDMDFLKNTLERFGYSGNILYIDTLSLSRHLIKGLPNYKQETIANYFGLHNQNAHRAVTDAEICGNIFLNLLELMKNEIEKEIIRAANCKPSITEQTIKNALKESNEETLQKLAKGTFAKDLKKTTNNIAELVQKYVNKDIGEVQLIDGLINSGFRDLSGQFLEAAGIDKSVLYDEKGNLQKLSSPAIGYCATVKAYEMMMKALEDAYIAYEHRLLVEEECKKTIELIREYRAEMEEAVNRYLNRHYETFERAFETMNQALLENDSDGYIRGNVEIQKLLGYGVQFTNQEEFDDLMDSDIALKL